MGNSQDQMRALRFAKCLVSKMAILGGLLVFASSSSVFAAQKTATAATEAPTAEMPPLSRGMPTQREVEVVIVWGFRIRPTEHDLRVASIQSGYAELITRKACETSICGFVVVPENSKWRATNVIVASEAELSEMHRNMERPDTTLVIVHPTGQKRTVPNF